MTATIAPPARAAHAAPAPDRRFRLLAGDPVWARVSLLVLLAGTAVLYLWNLSASGWANEFYAAATQAGSMSWKAWFFGALDPGSVITVDKPPAALWLSGLSARIFGMSSWSLLVPQALCGVAAVGLLYGAVRRWSGPVAGLLAGAALAVTPAAALMFRFDNPDALLTLLLVAGAYCVVRAVEAGRTSWLLLAGTALGFAFLTKMLQAFLVLPAFALVYLVAAPVPLWRRVWQLLAAGLAVVVSAGWWVLAVALWPGAPYIGGSTDGTVLNLVFGYNGLGRIFGGDGNGGGGGGGPGGGGGQAGSSFGGPAGLSRLFSSEMGNEVSWLLPAAIVALAGGLWVTRRRLRTDRTRAALLLWGGWALVTGLTFSYMSGTVHPYYTVALAPALGALVAIGGREFWARRATLEGRVLLAVTVAAAGFWAVVLLGRASWHPELRYAIAVLTAVAAVGLLVASGRVLVTGLLTAGIVAGLAGPSAYAVATAATPHTGSIPSVGPASASAAGGGFGGGGTGGAGGGSASTELTTLLQRTTTTWAAATTGSSSAATLQLSSGKAVIAIGGFNGGDPAPTLAQFQQYVAAGQIAYYVAGGGMGGGGMGGGNGAAAAIQAWVQANYSATTVGGTTVYALTG
jgi:4-amino-4-deoxy-L-arabinose transferase-like glycosyltransferase